MTTRDRLQCSRPSNGELAVAGITLTGRRWITTSETQFRRICRLVADHPSTIDNDLSGYYRTNLKKRAFADLRHLTRVVDGFTVIPIYRRPDDFIVPSLDSIGLFETCRWVRGDFGRQQRAPS
ncbi:hypothetical protein C8039_05675 [Halogeometricum sp. wsp3]|nr:hypothetical protein C8039_05675 [Halogeometricum sp. wsp3]